MPLGELKAQERRGGERYTTWPEVCGQTPLFTDWNTFSWFGLDPLVFTEGTQEEFELFVE